METGKNSKAMNCLTGEPSSGILSPNDTINGKNVYEFLKVKHRQKIGKTDELKQFNKFTETEKNSKAMKCLTGEPSSGILSSNDTINGKNVYELLKEKHPTPSQVNINYVVNKNTFESIPYHPAIFENLGALAVKNAALKTHGSKAVRFRRKRLERNFYYFKEVSANIVKTGAKIATRLANEKIS